MKRNSPQDVWKNVDIKSNDECWEWRGTCDKNGYGQIAIARKIYRTHRVAYFISRPGEIEMSAPKDKKSHGFILHSCDNRKCCNPNHMRVGTYLENHRDMTLKNRAPNKHGDKNPNSKLSKSQVLEIRNKLSSGKLRSEVAREYNVKWSCIHRIYAGISWNA